MGISAARSKDGHPGADQGSSRMLIDDPWPNPEQPFCSVQRRQARNLR
jgi:hypothetical protein